MYNLKKRGELKRANTSTKDLRKNDIIILVMGATGAGKSTFINTLADSSVASVGHDLSSHTSAIEPFTIEYPEDAARRVVMVDTPGFDDTYLEDSEILRRISVWIARIKKHKLRLTGIVYLHEISQSRMLGMSRNIDMLNKLCGEETTRNIILVTTKWDCVKEDVGHMRERELADNWKRMLDLGSVMCRLGGSSESAWGVVDLLLANSERGPAPTSGPQRQFAETDGKEGGADQNCASDIPSEEGNQEREEIINRSRRMSIQQFAVLRNIPRPKQVVDAFRIPGEIERRERRSALHNTLRDLLEAQKITITRMKENGSSRNSELQHRLNDEQNRLHSALQQLGASSMPSSRREHLNLSRTLDEISDIQTTTTQHVQEHWGSNDIRGRLLENQRALKQYISRTNLPQPKRALTLPQTLEEQSSAQTSGIRPEDGPTLRNVLKKFLEQKNVTEQMPVANRSTSPSTQQPTKLNPIILQRLRAIFKS